MEDAQENSVQRACTKAETISAKKYVKKFGQTVMVTNKFVTMMTDSLACALRVLKKDKRIWLRGGRLNRLNLSK